MQYRRHILITVALWAALAAFMMLCRPDSLPVVVLIVPFVLLFAALYNLWRLIGTVLGGGQGRYRRLGFAICLSAVLLLVLQSLGQLTPRDVITVVAIVALGYFYFLRVGAGLKEPPR